MDAIAIFYCEGRSLEKVIIQCKNNEPMVNIFERFGFKIDSKINNFEFYYKGKKIQENATIISIKENKQATDIDINYRIRSKIMKCPECICNNCVIKIKNYRLNFTDCCHKHICNDKIFDKYESSQNIEFDKIRCNKCQKTQSQDLKEFYKCLKCSKNFQYATYFCSECSFLHPHNQQLIKYDEKYFYCQEHFRLYISYCYLCKKNLCDICEKNERNKNHEVKKYEQMIPDVNPIKKNLEEIKIKIEDLKIVVDQIKNTMDGAVRIMEQYYNIAQDILGKYESFNTKYKNFQTIESVKNLEDSNKDILKALTDITEGNPDLQQKCKMLIKIYSKDRDDYKGKEEIFEISNINSNLINNNINNINNINNFTYYGNIQQLEMRDKESPIRQKRLVNIKKPENSIGKGSLSKKK